MRKNIVISEASALRSPIIIANSIINPVKIIAFRGSLFEDLAEKNLKKGTVFFSASACKTLGAPTMLPSAEEKVAAKTPAMTIGLHNALSIIAI